MRKIMAVIRVVLIFNSIIITFGTDLDQVKYTKIGTLTNNISSSFAIYEGLSKIRCFSICAKKKCKMLGWGKTNKTESDCRVPTQKPRPKTSLASFNPLSIPLSIYTPVDSGFNFVQRDYGLLLHSKHPLSWQGTHEFCRQLGLGLYLPSNIEDLRDLNTDYSQWWAGASDLEEEGTFATDEGTPVPEDLWCPDEPNNMFENEDCAESHSDLCMNDNTCSDPQHGFCKIGV